MANRTNKKRQRSRTAELKRRQEKPADRENRKKSRWDPTGRALLWGDLVFLAIVSLLEVNELISKQVGGLCTVLALIVLLTALWLLFGRKKGDGPGKGPRL